MIHPSVSLSDQQNTLLSILTCLICQNRACQAHICPNCSKFFCLSCITQWIVDRNANCPYCTEPLKQKDLVNCQNLFDELSNAMEAMKSAQIKRQKKCQNHSLPLNYYCQDCKIELCSDCCVLFSQHKGHKFLKADQAKKQFEKENTLLKNLLNHTKQQTQKLLHFIKQNSGCFQQNLQKDYKKFTQFIKNLKQRTNKKFISQITGLQKIIEVEKSLVKDKNDLYDKSLSFMKECSKIQFVATEADLLEQKIACQLKDTKESNVQLRQKLLKHQGKKFESQIYPAYQTKTFTWIHYGQLCYQNAVAYSDILSVNGVEWRLKIYPAGSPEEQIEPRKEQAALCSKNILDCHMSAFVQMKSSLREKGKYRHRVAIEHPSNSGKNIERQFESEFDRGQCWGYDKFIKISHLYDAGFVDMKNQEIRITLMIAPANYYEACEDMKSFITKRRDYLKEMRVEKALKFEGTEMQSHID